MAQRKSNILRVGDRVELAVTDARLREYNLEGGWGRLELHTIFQNPQFIDGKETIELFVPLSLPVFSVGPYPYTYYTHPLVDNNDLVWVDENSNVVSYRGRSWRLILDPYFFIMGHYILSAMDVEEEIKFKAKKMTPKKAKALLDLMLNVRMTSRDLLGRVSSIVVKNPVTDAYKVTIVDKESPLIIKNKLTATVIILVDNSRSEIMVPLKFVKLYENNLREKDAERYARGRRKGRNRISY